MPTIYWVDILAVSYKSTCNGSELCSGSINLYNMTLAPQTQLIGPEYEPMT